MRQRREFTSLIPSRERRSVHEIIKTQEVALIVIVFLVAGASTLSRAIRDGDRRSGLRLFGLGCTSGFLGIGLYCVGSAYLYRIIGPGSNLVWIGVAAFIGFTAKNQDKIGSELFVAIVNKLLGGTIAALSALNSMTKKKADEE